MSRGRDLLRRTVPALAGTVLVLAGCGGNGESDAMQSGGDASAGPGSGGEMMPAADVARVVRAQRELAACRAGRDARGVDGAASTLVAVYEDGPERIYQFGSSTRLGRPMRDVLQESRTALRECGDSDALARVDRALAADD